MNAISLIIAAGLLMLACVVIALALMKASTTRYRCACPFSQIRCSNPVGGAGGVCHDCLSGRHGGHV